MRVLMFTNSYRPLVGGVEASIVAFRRGLERAGHEVAVVAPDRPDARGDERLGRVRGDEPLTFRIPAVAIPGKTFDAALPLPARTTLEVITRGFNPHVVHTHHPFLIGDSAAELAGRMGLPLVYTFHTRYAEYAREHFPLVGGIGGVVDDLVSRYLRRCDRVIAPSPSIRRLIDQRLDPRIPVTVVPTPVDLAAYRDARGDGFRSRWGLSGSEVVAYVGRLVVEKNIDLAIDAFARVAAERPAARLVVVGRGPEEGRIRHRAESLGLGSRVVLCGSVPHTEVPEVMAAADLLCVPSETETQGLVAVEAMAAGTPVVAVEGAGSTDVLAEGGGPLVPATVDGLADGIRELLADPAARQRLGAAGRAAAARFDVPSAVASLVEAYREAGARRAAPLTADWP